MFIWVIIVKKNILKIIAIIFIYYFMFKYLNVGLYEGVNLPWFSLEIEILYFLSFSLTCLNFVIFRNNNYMFYIALVFQSLCFVVDKIEIVLLVLYFGVLFSGYCTNFLYRNNKKFGYASLVYLVFMSYLLVSNQMIIILN